MATPATSVPEWLPTCGPFCRHLLALVSHGCVCVCVCVFAVSFAESRESLCDRSARESAPVSQYNLQRQACGTRIVMGCYNINLSANSKMDQSYEFLTDRQRTYNIVIEYVQNMMDWVTTFVNACLVGPSFFFPPCLHWPLHTPPSRAALWPSPCCLLTCERARARAHGARSRRAWT